MFTMIGGDGQEYGPVTAEQLREWILDHRANGRTLVRAEGETEWKPLFLRPEFAETLTEAARLHAPAAVPTGEGTGAGGQETAAEASGAGPSLRVLDCVSRGWGTLTRHPLLILAACFWVWLLPTGLAFLGWPGALTGWLISGALYGGLCVLVLDLVRGQPSGSGRVWSGFRARFLPCLLVWVFTDVAIQLGLMLLLVPGISLAVMWAFSLPLAAAGGLDFVPALRASWQAVWPRFFTVLGLLLLAFLPTVVFAGYSLVATMRLVADLLGPGGPASWAVLIERFPDLARQAAELGLQQHAVWLLNLPFAWPVLMTAYDDLFGTARSRRA